MFKHGTVILLVALTALALVAGSVCGPKAPPVTPEEVVRPSDDDRRVPPPPTPDPKREVVKETPFEQERPSSKDIGEDARLAQLSSAMRTIFFAYDSDELTTQARSTLRDNAEMLKAYPQFNVVVEGHCDERGTIEYNLALGERRAASVRDYLVSLGVSRGRIRIVTYGEERPVDYGHAESAWSKNRRAEFRVER